MHVRILIPLAIIALVIVAAACGGDDDDSDTNPLAGSTPIPTATPYARVPDPIIVSGAPPSVAAQSVTYIVEAGDSLSAIAEQFETTVQAILDENGLTDATFIFTGQELSIPAPDSVAVVSGSTDDGESADTDDGGSDTSTTNGAAPPAQVPGTETYVVQPGDTALGIAFEFNVTLEDLAAANGVTVADLTNINAGDELLIP